MSRITLICLGGLFALLTVQRLPAQQIWYEGPPYQALSDEYPNLKFDWELNTLPRRTLFALKTNLLFDAITAVNLEIEVPIGSRYSVAAEWIFPWWLTDSRQRCFELLCGTVEGRYWLGKQRTEEDQLLGWAVGLYAGCGYYDLEWDGKGRQGENVIAGGVSGSYAHLIGEHLRLEYSLGLGMLTTKYRKYEAEKCDNEWILLRTERGRTNWFGPTRARISLVWMLTRPDRRGGEL